MISNRFQALPDELNFGTVPYGKTKSLSFHVFNFSSIKIFFKLICKQRSLPIGNITRDVEVRPVNQTVFPGSNVKIDVDLTPREPGFYQLMVQYLLRPNSLANETLSTFEPRDICALNCMCIFPGFEVLYTVISMNYYTLDDFISDSKMTNLRSRTCYILPIENCI